MVMVTVVTRRSMVEAAVRGIAVGFDNENDGKVGAANDAAVINSDRFGC